MQTELFIKRDDPLYLARKLRLNGDRLRIEQGKGKHYQTLEHRAADCLTKSVSKDISPVVAKQAAALLRAGALKVKSYRWQLQASWVLFAVILLSIAAFEVVR